MSAPAGEIIRPLPVANVPFAGLPGADYSQTRRRFEALREALLDESGAGPADAAGPIVGPVAVVSEPGCDLDPFLPQPESREWFLRVGRGEASTWRNQVTLCHAFGSEPNFDPGVCVEYLAPTPLLLVVASEDRLADTAITLEAFERARDATGPSVVMTATIHASM